MDTTRPSEDPASIKLVGTQLKSSAENRKIYLNIQEVSSLLKNEDLHGMNSNPQGGHENLTSFFQSTGHDGNWMPTRYIEQTSSRNE
jgi:hypothetical protein